MVKQGYIKDFQCFLQFLGLFYIRLAWSRTTAWVVVAEDYATTERVEGGFGNHLYIYRCGIRTALGNLVIAYRGVCTIDEQSNAHLTYSKVDIFLFVDSTQNHFCLHVLRDALADIVRQFRLVQSFAFENVVVDEICVHNQKN